MVAAPRYRSYAKINLYLDVLERRADGFHDIETIFQTVDLSDTLEFEPHAAGIAVESNLVYRAAKLLSGEAGRDLGVRVAIHKRIPVAAGLAGGSGNAAAALVAIDRLCDLRIPKDRLGELALMLGSDVPYCLEGGTMAATGRGERLTPLPPIHPVWFVLLHPRIAVSTPWVYNHPDLPRNAAPRIEGRTRGFDEAIARLASGDIAGTLFNAMESVVFVQYPGLGQLKQRLLDAGCCGARMSGSGPTVFGVCTSESQAREVATRFRDVGWTIAGPVFKGLMAEGT